MGIPTIITFIDGPKKGEVQLGELDSVPSLGAEINISGQQSIVVECGLIQSIMRQNHIFLTLRIKSNLVIAKGV